MVKFRRRARVGGSIVSAGDLAVPHLSRQVGVGDRISRSRHALPHCGDLCNSRDDSGKEDINKPKFKPNTSSLCKMIDEDELGSVSSSDEEVELDDCGVVENTFEEGPPHKQRCKEPIDTPRPCLSDLSSFIRATVAESLPGSWDMQVVDIEVQQRPRCPELDDPDVMMTTVNPVHKWKRGREYQFSVPCIRIYGKTRVGASVCLNVYGYYPTVHLLTACDPSIPGVVDEITDIVIAYLKKQEDRERSDAFKYILGTSIKTGFPAFPYSENPASFIEFKLALPRYTKVFGEFFLNNKTIDLNSVGPIRVTPYSCINIVEQFQADRRIAGFSWVTVHSAVPTNRSADRCDASRCELEMDVSMLNVTPIQDDSIAPIRFVAWDIECLKTKGLPKPEENPIIIISAVCVEYINGERTRKRNVVIQADSGDDLPLDQINPKNGDVHMRFTGDNAERSMIDAFGLLIQAFDPDFISGHNIVNFDLPYVVKRANFIGCSEAEFLGRRGQYKWFPPRINSKKRKNGSESTTTSTDTPGRIQLDTLPWIMNLKKLWSYKLGYLASLYLKDTKSDVPYQLIGTLWHTSDESRQRLSGYCLKDSLLAYGLVDYQEFCMVLTSIEMARQTRVCAARLLRSGQQAKVFGIVYEKAKMPGFDDKGSQVYFPYERPRTREKDDKYEGATVLEPSRGFYTDPIFCGDYRSLYPSIIIDLNIDWTTEILNNTYLPFLGKTSPNGVRFVKAEKRRGLIPQMEIELMDARDKAKAQMKKYPRYSGLYNLYNSRQDQLKLIMNSAYGILNASGGRLARMELALSVTTQGRVMIAIAKRIGEAEPFKATVVYGVRTRP